MEKYCLFSDHPSKKTNQPNKKSTQTNSSKKAWETQKKATVDHKESRSKEIISPSEGPCHKVYTVAQFWGPHYSKVSKSK